MKTRLTIIGVFLFLATATIMYRLAQIQLNNDKIYSKDGTQKHISEKAKYGKVFDRNGVVLWDRLYVKSEREQNDLKEKDIYFYTHLEGLSAILGGVINSNIRELRGQDGVRLSTYKPRKDVPINEREIIPLIDGKDVYLSIDLRIQEIVENAVHEFVPKFGAAGASVLIMDPRTGQILALTSFNPDSKKYESTIHSFEPGSIFKPITAIIALENGVDPNKRINTENGKWQVTKNVNEKIIKDTHEMESCNMQEAMIHSSNIAFGKYVVEEVGYGKFYDGVRNFGISDNPSDFPLRVVHKGFKRVNESRTQATQGIGQSVDATSIDVARAFSSIANGGVLYNPKLILKNGKEYASIERDSVRRVISSTENTRLLREMLKGVVEKGGTAENVKSKFEFFEFAGKTGTAQVIDSLGKYASGTYNSSFIGMERASDPHFVCIVTMYNTKRAGATVAGPVFQRIMEQIYLHPSLSPETFAKEYAPADSLCSETSFIGYTKLAAFDKANGMRCDVRFRETGKGNVVAQTIKKDSIGEYLELSLREHQRNTGIMPDVIGLTLRDAIGMLEHVKVNYEGSGKVYKQIPEPGNPVEKNSKVLIKLRESV